MNDRLLALALKRALLSALAGSAMVSCSSSGIVASAPDAHDDATTSATDSTTGALDAHVDVAVEAEASFETAEDVGTCDPLPSDAMMSCYAPYVVPIAGSTSTCARAGDAGDLTAEACNHVCAFPAGEYGTCHVVSTDSVECRYYCIVDGRRPCGLVPPRVARSSELGEYFARVAHMEAASIHAFEILARELEQFGAPPSLVERARLAAGDEVHHAKTMTTFARRFGGSPPSAEIAPAADRSLEQMALENEIEGCVRETFSALQALHQAAVAADSSIRAAMGRIALEEERHAALSWAIAAWTRTRLDAEACDRLDAARVEAIDRLEGELAHEPATAVSVLAGVPSARRAAQLLAAARREVWS